MRSINIFDLFKIVTGIVLLLFIYNMLKTGDTSFASNVIAGFFKFISDIVSSILTPIFERALSRIGEG